jgi:hypothetical protein
MGRERRTIRFDDPIEKGLLRTATLITASIPVPTARPGHRNMDYDTHPCDKYCLSISLARMFHPIDEPTA